MQQGRLTAACGVCARRRSSASAMGGEIGRIRPTKVFERAGESRMTPPASSISSQVRPRISFLRLSVSNSLSGRHWELDQVPAVGDPTDIVQFGTGHHVSANEGRRRVALQRRVAAYLVVVGLKVAKFSFKITGIPEQHMVEIFSPRRADQALHEWVGPGHMRHGLDCFDRAVSTSVRQPVSEFTEAPPRARSGKGPGRREAVAVCL